MGNICKAESSSEENKYKSEVHGSIFALNKIDKAKLDGMEASYDSVPMEVHTYKDDYENSTKKILEKYTCFTYIFTQEKGERLKKEKEEGKDVALVPVFRRDRKPGLNYLETLIRGATEIGLEKGYIEYLKSHSAIGFHPFDISAVKWPTDPVRLFTMSEVEKSKSPEAQARYMVAKGIVFELPKSLPKIWIAMFVGNDMTLFFAKRWAWSDDSVKDLKSLQQGQKDYINDQLWLLASGHW
ncbi:hypothetical protein RFI_27162 [Reticulomyxa filosa]|uniref:Uncharacterized protein n=1 Tax=Reticulomyxa filosa TaxID=46433 RepID=X6M8A0_RETFI|nr:hypothetical protein RFI_27162 [Reticulomyxa filosa]|eukprot:ETO10213.1 hypothetical protein RFI_27162 [Reticulomyxa filosa]